MEDEAGGGPGGDEDETPGGLGPTITASMKITMFGLRRAVISRKKESIGFQTWMWKPEMRMKMPSSIRFSTYPARITRSEPHSHSSGILWGPVTPRPTKIAQYQNGGWIRSMPWS